MFRLLALALVLLTASCQPSSGAPTPNPEPEKPQMVITSMTLKEYPGVESKIDNSSNTIYMTLPYGAILGKATIVYTLTEGIAAVPESGTKVSINAPVDIYLSDEDGRAAKWTLNVSVAPSSDVVLTQISENSTLTLGNIEGNRISFLLPAGTDLTSLTFTAETLAGTTFEPAIDSPVDLSEPKILKVIAPDGVNFKEYTLSAQLAEPEVAVRAVYLPAPHHTSSFSNYTNAKASIDLMAELNFNCLFLCVWANSKIGWDSEVLMANSTYAKASDANMYASYTGGSGDAIKDIIELAHARDIKVIFWFEYGFMHRIGSKSVPNDVNLNDPIVKKHPEWLGIGNDGGYSNYNGTDYYLNSYDPEVQEFMLSLMEEALEKYPEVDGIQGDDRLPAMPRNSGYDVKTKAAYKAAKGVEPPYNYDDAQWVRWRLDNLNSFAVTMYNRLKSRKSDLIVCFAPNKYPWCEGVLMQEWPAWIRAGVVDFLTVQFYVLGTYESDVRTAMRYVSENSRKNLLNPAMILKNGSTILDKETLIRQLQFNRSVGTNGEAQFWFDGLKTEYVKDVFRTFYKGKAVFPQM